MSRHRVFVYGSLMREFNNHCLLEGAKYLGTGHIRGWTMHDLGPFPGIRPVPSNHAGIVQGELYEVDDETLEDLDRLEGVPNFYLRREVNVYLPRGNGSYATVKGLVYFLANPSGSPVVPGGNWRSHVLLRHDG